MLGILWPDNVITVYYFGATLTSSLPISLEPLEAV